MSQTIVSLPLLEGRDSFLSSILTTGIEHGLEPWFDYRNYRRSDTSIELCECSNSATEWVIVNPERLRASFGILASGKISGLAESYRGRLISLYFVGEPGDMDRNDADILFQLLAFGEVRYG